MKRTATAKPSTKLLNLALPKDLLAEASKIAKRRGCSAKELIRSLLRSEALNA